MDLMTITGFIIGCGALYYVMWTGQAVQMMFNLDAAILVFGGTLGCALITYPWRIIRTAPRAVWMMFFPPKRVAPDKAIEAVVAIATQAKRQGIENMSDEVSKVSYPFLRDSLTMVIEGMEADTIHEKLEKEIAVVRRRHYQVSSVFRSMGGYAPIFGLLGTLIGVVQVLRNLTDAQSMGSSMAIAVTATFYGIFGANFLFLPIAGKLTIYSEEEMIIKELFARGVMAIQKGEVPIVIERQLEAFLSYQLRNLSKTPAKKK